MLINQESFSGWIETNRAKTQESYIDTVLEGCEIFGIDIELSQGLLNQQIIGKIKAEAIEMNIFKSESESLGDFL